ncbi:DUF6766 family protein [Flavobacterium sp. YJ01]|uniref:DUF6766 family protein n=1 Tax=unclassified Flavobacterium TaxID=196869 RepID=UPI0023E46706|nr:DUF6766 family protein [Flavobacterium sp. YJ01]WET02399.1 hypothetical protein P0R33_21840 [Flavobacterium sp. YJ01]
MKTWLRSNGLSICFFILFLGSIAGQTFFGYQEHNKELAEEKTAPIKMSAYLKSGHFIQATFENWESEFLQMGLLVVLTIFLQQKGSSESKDFDREQAVDREPSARRKGSPWPVKKGGLTLKVYKHSLTIALMLFFAFSFVMHFYGSLKDENEKLRLTGKPEQSAMQYAGSSRFWFESFQNWQSEFLSVFAIVLLSVYLRQIGSSQSKPVDAPDSETGA